MQGDIGGDAATDVFCGDFSGSGEARGNSETTPGARGTEWYVLFDASMSLVLYVRVWLFTHESDESDARSSGHRYFSIYGSGGYWFE